MTVKTIDMEQRCYQDMTTQLKQLQEQFRQLKLYKKRADLFNLADSLSAFRFLSAFLDLEQLSLTAALGKSLADKILQENRPIGNEYLQLFSRLFNTIVEIIRQVRRNTGSMVDSSQVRLSRYWIESGVDILPLMKAMEKQQIRTSESFCFRSLNITRDQDFAHAIKIPAQILRQAQNKRWLTLFYLDIGRIQKDHHTLLEQLQNAEEKGELLLHGRLNLPDSSYDDQNPGIPYYLLIESETEPREWLSANRLEAKIIRQIKTPDTQSQEKPVEIQDKPQAQIERVTEIVKEIPVASEELIHSLKALAERNQREEDREYYRQLNMKKGKSVKDGKGLSIGFKMILIIFLVLTSSLSCLTLLSLFYFKADISTRIEEENLVTSTLLAQKTEQDFWRVFNTSQLLILGLTGEEQDKEYLNFFFRRNPEFIYIGTPDGQLNFFNQDFLLNHNVSEEFILQVVLPEKSDLYDEVSQGTGLQDTRIFNLSPYFKSPVSGVAFPYRRGADADSLIVLIDTDQLLGNSIRSVGAKTSFILTQEGEMIAYPEDESLLRGVWLEDHPVIREIQDRQGEDKQISYSRVYTDPLTGENKQLPVLGSFKRIDFGNLVFITEVEEELVFESVEAIQRRNIYIMVIVLSLSILIIYFYSKSITTPISRLVVATRYIEKGNYRLPLKIRSRDEMGTLTKSFIDMGKGLEEKEQLKDNFGRFVNQEVAEMAMKGELALGGETKEATVFFSDIRSFTEISEKLTPEEVVKFLNEYMTLMVHCITESGGFVDKFIGDAIMAVWGAPLSRGNDEERAIDSSLKMRQVLIEFNKNRGGERKPIIRIGCGINSGPVLSGQIGSDTKMEFTVIGDTVNLASRIEGLNKPMGTDILISEETRLRVEGIYHLVPMNKIKVKGKSEPQQIYAVLGRKDDPHCPENLSVVREQLGIKGQFKNITDLNKKEVKYEIIS